MPSIASLSVEVRPDGIAATTRQLGDLDKAGQKTNNTVSKMAGVWKAAIAASPDDAVAIKQHVMDFVLHTAAVAFWAESCG